MEAIDNGREMEKTKLVSEFYYSLALLQSKAIQYVAYGETVDDKLLRIKDVIMSVEKTGNEILANDVPAEDCGSCCWDYNLKMCICNLQMSNQAYV
jgi:hypothetical protein